jgi:hypothetical protein
LSGRHSAIVQKKTKQLTKLIAQGTNRPGQTSSNDTDVRFDTIQVKRWAPGLKRANTNE